MTKRTTKVLTAVLCACALIFIQFGILKGTAENISLKTTMLWYEDDFESKNEAKIALDNNAKTESADGRVSIGVAVEDNTNNSVLQIVKTAAPADKNVNTQRINYYPQKSDGSYGLINDGSIENNKTYKYIVQYDYKVQELSGNNGMYVFTGCAPKNANFTNDKKNTQGCCLASNSLYTQDIGTYGMLNLVAPVGEWQTITTTTYYSSKNELSNPAIILQFELWRDFVGTVLFDNIKIYQVNENDNVATAVFNCNDNGETRLNPVTYIAGAKFSLPIPKKSGYDFIGWYSDKAFTELCDNTLPINKVNGKYSVLYARWNEKTLTDDFEQTNNKNRKLTSNLSIVNDVGVKDSKALKFAGNNSSSKYVPIDLKGNKYTVSAEKNKNINYLLEFEYKADKSISSNGVDISFDFVGVNDNKSVSSKKQPQFSVSSKTGNADGTWRKASYALRFNPSKTVVATFALIFECKDNAEILIDNINIQKTEGRIGSYIFNKDKYTEYIDPVAGEYNELSGIDMTSTRSGYEFDGWYFDGKKVNINTFDEKDYVLTPKWKELTALENTTQIFSDDFDEESVNKRSIYDDVVVGPDTSTEGWYTDDFEQYNGTTININDNYEKTDRPAGLSLTVEKESDGNSYFRFKNTDNVNYLHNLIFRDSNGKPLYNKSLSKSKKYTVIYKFKYKVNSAPADGMWMSSLLCDKDKNNASAKGKCFILSETDYSATSYFCGNIDGNWHTVSFAANYQPTTDKEVTPGFYVEFGSVYSVRKVDICFDDVYVKVIEGENKAINYLCSAEPKSGQIGPTIEKSDVLAAELNSTINFSKPYSDEYKFVGWTNAFGRAVTKAPATSTGSSVTVYPKWEELTGSPVPASVVEYKISKGFGTGNTSTLKLSSASAGQGSINLKNALGETLVSTLNANEKTNWIVKFRYKVTDPGKGVKMNFDISEPGSSDSLSVEGGTTASITFGGANTNNDSKWHIASLPVSLTRNNLLPSAPFTLKIDFLASSAFGAIYLDEISVFDAGTKPVSMFEFVNRDFVDPIAGVVGTKTVMPANPVALRSVGAWFNDKDYKDKFADVNASVTFINEYKTLYGESLTYDGFYATERFDNTTNIHIERMNSNSNLQYLWDRYGLIGKRRKFTITQEECHDESKVGYSLKYDLRDDKYAADPASSILLTNGIDDQIKLGNTHDEEEKMYIVKFWYKVVETNTDVKMSISAANYNSEWEGLNCDNEAYQYPVMNTTNGEWRQMSMLLGLCGDAEEKDIYVRFSVTGQALIYFDDFEFIKVKSGKGQTILFDTNGGNFIEPLVGEQGETIPKLPNAVKEGSTFKGWYTDFGYTTLFNQTKFGSSNIYLNALFEENDDTNSKDNDGSKNFGIYVDSTNCQKQTHFIIDKLISGIEYGEYTISFDCLPIKSEGTSSIRTALSGPSGECLSAKDFSDFKELEWQNVTLSIMNDKKATNLKFYIGAGFQGYIDNIVLKDSSGKVIASLDFDSDRDLDIIVEDESGLFAYLKECPGNDSDSFDDIDFNNESNTDIAADAQYEDIIERYPVKYDKRKTTTTKVKVYDDLPLWLIILIIVGCIVLAGGITVTVILIKKKKIKLFKRKGK